VPFMALIAPLHGRLGPRTGPCLTMAITVSQLQNVTANTGLICQSYGSCSFQHHPSA